ncbi:MAG: hypothetical protein GQ564_05835 [Bacteroidales bacterium]|nr:hypothetical protein [Bacteroidales bacterium]
MNYTVYYSKCHICKKQIWIEYITTLTIIDIKAPHYMRHFEKELVLSPTQKLKRSFVYDKYKHITAEIYKNGKKQ